MAYNEELTMMVSVVPGSLTGISALMGGLSSITNVFTDITRQVDANFGLIDTSIIAASTIIGQFGLKAAESFGQFEQGMKVAQMVSGQTAQEMDYLKQKANEFSVSYRVDIDQITEGLQTLGRAGLNSAAEQTEVLESGLNTAKLEGRDLNGVLEELIQNTALLGGNLKSSDFGENSKYLNDVMVATSMTAPITTHDVSETLKYSGGIAAAAGANVTTEEGKAILEDYMGAIAAFAQKGVTGSIAGTALRAFFNKPATQDTSVTDALASINLKPEYLWEDDEETMKPVSEQIAIIKNQMDDLNVSTMDQLQIWSKIVGGKMGQQMMKLDSDNIKELTKDIQSANDAESLASGTFDTYQMKMKEMAEQGQVAFRQFGKYAAEVLTPVLEILKRILEFFSNPAVSLGAFLGAFALILSSISKIKNVFSSLKQEFAQIMHYMKTGEPLMAVRPSTVRKSNRFNREELERKYPGQSELTAYSREKNVENDEFLMRKFGKDNALIYKQAQTLNSNFLGQRGQISDMVGLARMLPGANLAAERGRLDSLIAKFLLEEKLWTEEFTQTYYEVGQNLRKTIEIHSEDIEKIIYDKLGLYRKPSDAKKTNDLRKQYKTNHLKGLHSKDPFNLNNKGQKPDVEPYKEREASYNELVDKGREGSQYEAIRRFIDSDVHKREAFDYEGMVAKQKAKLANLSIEGRKKSGNRMKQRVQDEFIESFVTSFEADFGSEDLGASPLYSMIRNKDDLQVFGRFLRKHGMLSGYDSLDSKIMNAIWENVEEGRATAADKRVDRFLKENKENKMGFTARDYAVMSNEDFLKHVGKIPSTLSLNSLRQAFLRREGISSPQAMLSMLGIMEFNEYAPVSIEDIGEIFGLTGKDFQKAYNQYERLTIKGHNPAVAASKKSNEKADARKRKKREEKIRNRHMKSAAEMLGVNLDDGVFADNVSFLLNSKDYQKLLKMTSMSYPMYLKRSDMINRASAVYGKDLIQSEVKGLGSGRKKVAEKLFPYFADWNDLSDKEMASFAPKLGVTDLSGTRKDVIDRLNKTLTKDSVYSEIEAQNVYNGDIKETIHLLQEEAKILDSIILKMKEISGMPQENAKLQEEIKAFEEKYTVPNEDRESIRKRFGIDEWEQRSIEIMKRHEDEYDITGVYPNAPEEYRNPRIEKEKQVQEMKDSLAPESYEVFESSTKVPEVIRPNGQELKNILSSGRFTIEAILPPEVMNAALKRLENEENLSRIKQEQLDYESMVSRVSPVHKMGVQVQDVEKTGLSQVKDKISGFYTSAIKEPLSTAKESFMRRLDADRSDSFLNFGQGSKANKALNVIDMLGGPFMVATGAATLAIEAWTGAFNDYCEDLKKADSELKEAYSEWNSAEDALKRTYQNGNPDATDEEINDMILETYSTMNDDMEKAIKNGQGEWLKKLNTEAEKGTELVYDEEKDDGSLVKKEEEEISEEEEYQKAIKENTGALYAATAKLNIALSKMSGKMADSWWGSDGWTGWLTDQWGGFMDKVFKGGSKFSDENEFLLTQSQADENYQGYTEMAGLMMEDFKDAGGNWIKGMRTMMGDDVDNLAKILPKTGQNWMYSLANSSTGVGSISSRDNAKLQLSMKNDTKTWKSLAREYAKRDVNKKQGRDTQKNLTRIKGLTQKIQGTLSSGFNETHIKQAAYIMQMQEMYKVAQNTMVPIMSTNTSLAGSTLLAANGISTKTGTTSQNAGGTWGTAQVISGLVAIIAKTKAKEVAWQTAYEADPNSTDLNGDGYDETDKAIIELAQKTNSPDDFAKEAAKMYNTSVSDLTPYNNHGVYSSDYPGSGDVSKDQAPALFIAQVYEAAAKMTGYGYSAEDANKFAQQAVKGVAGKSLSDIYNTFGKNYTENPDFQQKLIDNYLDATEEGEGDGSGGGGSGSGDKGDNQGNKKERVDLVLCSKKEIPKLNVNLFKKPPTFTVLNKNFKVRDVKINTEDTPKAIMSAIKNSFIDVQKRSDPKIIQDEDAVYDPNEATDGNPLPSGTAKTRTDS